MDKQHILDEIRRTAKENGGDPLGRERFQTQTGIKTTDWYGKYWIRWGDALLEAGLKPNQWQEPYEDELLIAKLISLTRELGKFPVEGDLRIKGRNDPNSQVTEPFVALAQKCRGC